MRTIILAGLFLAVPVSAQETTCTKLGNVTRCSTEPTTRGPIDYSSQIKPDPITFPQRRERHTGPDRGVSKRVGKMVAAGDCEGAYKYALKKGELDLAERAKGMCK